MVRRLSMTSNTPASMLFLAAAAAAMMACGSASPVAEPTEKEPPVTKAPTPECLERLTAGHHDSVLDEQRRVGPRSWDFQGRYAAATIDRAAQVPVEVVKAYQLDGVPLLWFDAGKTAAVVDAAVLSDLVVADATRMRAGEQAAIGRLTPAALGKLAPRELVKFLIAARVVATYVHIGSELCLVEEQQDDAGYRARFTGSHTYFTNEENVDPLAFEVRIDAAGVITALGTAD
jgi:hypothetical protein